MSNDDPDLPALRGKLQAALEAQAASALHFTVVAGTLSGIAEQAISAKCEEFAHQELQATRALIDKAVALGCEVSISVPRLRPAPEAPEKLAELCRSEEAIIAALHAVIPETGQYPWSEALEHLLEHLIMRKQHQVDYLRRALGEH